MTAPEHIKNQPVILIGILDWGLGHATRMVPIIRYLLQFQCQILIATAQPQKKLLEREFPGLTYLDPPGYNVNYRAFAGKLVFGLIRQLPRLFRAVKQEELWTSEICKAYKVDAIISDNRYGFRYPGIPNIFITHQLAPLTGLGGLADHIAKKNHLRWIAKFSECWVPDLPGHGLAGRLSHPPGLQQEPVYIGPLSRFAPGDGRSRKKDQLLLLLSGPEPARTAFEQKLLSQLQAYERDYLLVRGLPATEGGPPNSVNHADADTLRSLIENATYIICRAGYTTIMDLASLGRTAVLVPTPGQTEQEYLATYLSDKGYFLEAVEKTFDLDAEVGRLRNFAPTSIPYEPQQFVGAVNRLLEKINNRN